MSQLHEDDLIRSDSGSFRYDRLGPTLEDVIGRLGETYQTQLVAVTKVIHSKPRRIREFANAFRLRKDRG